MERKKQERISLFSQMLEVCRNLSSFAILMFCVTQFSYSLLNTMFQILIANGEGRYIFDTILCPLAKVLSNISLFLHAPFNNLSSKYNFYPSRSAPHNVVIILLDIYENGRSCAISRYINHQLFNKLWYFFRAITERRSRI